MFIRRLKLFLLKRKYRKLNTHNETIIDVFCDINRIEVGKKSYGVISVSDFSPQNTKLKIGNYCSIAPGVRFLLGGEHNINTISTYPFKTKIFNLGREANSKGDIIVEDDVWIGTNAIICSGVTISRGAIVAAGSIVTKNVPPYSIVGGNPAKVIKKRFSDEIIGPLMSLNLSNVFDSVSRENLPLYYEPLSEKVLSEILESIE